MVSSKQKLFNAQRKKKTRHKVRKNIPQVVLTPIKPLPKFGTAADPFRFLDAHCWDFTK